MNPAAMKPQGQAILDYFKGDSSATVIMHSDDGEKMDVPASVFFREPQDWPPLERMAVDLCRGRILDVGAGAGCHSLHLQQRGLAACAIDISPEAVEVMKKRGVREVHRADVFRFQAQPFDTILMMMNGIGVVETLQGLDLFLKSMPRLLCEGGQILLDSHDARHEVDPDELAQWESYQIQPYFGEMTLRLEYKGQIGPSFGWLYVDSDTMTRHAEETGWFCEIVHREEDGAYLARLIRPG